MYEWGIIENTEEIVLYFTDIQQQIKKNKIYIQISPGPAKR